MDNTKVYLDCILTKTENDENCIGLILSGDFMDIMNDNVVGQIGLTKEKAQRLILTLQLLVEKLED